MVSPGLVRKASSRDAMSRTVSSLVETALASSGNSPSVDARECTAAEVSRRSPLISPAMAVSSVSLGPRPGVVFCAASASATAPARPTSAIAIALLLAATGDSELVRRRSGGRVGLDPERDLVGAGLDDDFLRHRRQAAI